MQCQRWEGQHTIHNPSLPRLKRPPTSNLSPYPPLPLPIHHLPLHLLIRKRNIRFRRRMLHLLLPPTINPIETQCSRENRPAALSRLDRPRHETPSIPHPFDVVEDWDL